MAEIHIERKKHHPFLIALIVIALILLALWAVWAMTRGDRDAAVAPVAATAQVAMTQDTAIPADATPASVTPDTTANGPADATMPVEPAPLQPAALPAPSGAAVAVPDVPATPTPVAPGDVRGPYVGTFVSQSIRLVMNADGSYRITESPAGPGQGAWRVDRQANAIILERISDRPDRYFRIQDVDTLIPLNPQGQPAAQMSDLLRREKS